MLISIPAIVGIGTTIANAKRIVPKSNFFILLPPYPVFIRKWRFPGWFGRVWLFPPFSLPHFIDRKYLGSRLEKAVSHISRPVPISLAPPHAGLPLRGPLPQCARQTSPLIEPPNPVPSANAVP
jgi:hypothetical protein